MEFLYGRRDGIRLSALADLIGLLPNPNLPGRHNMASLRPTAIPMVAVLELMLRAQVVLREDIGIGHQLCSPDGFACHATEDLR